jgi:hypothetical protein
MSSFLWRQFPISRTFLYISLIFRFLRNSVYLQENRLSISIIVKIANVHEYGQDIGRGSISYLLMFVVAPQSGFYITNVNFL